MFSAESPHRGDSNEYTQYTVLNIKKKLTLNYPKSAVKFSDKILWDFYKGLKNEFETAVVNEPSVFEPLKFYCIPIVRRPGTASKALETTRHNRPTGPGPPQIIDRKCP